MIDIRRRTRETSRHERATVLQQLGAQADSPTAWQAQRDLEMSRMRRAYRRGGDRRAEVLGLVTPVPAAGGSRASEPEPPACTYCGDQAGGCWYCGRG